mmetsp:Transcript_16474/g.40810  ORF Transcript_16474/g.40810 Transcript_16474/m.40810 type:complete len:223 (+) Transcript_16474:1388-2056(+)
MACSTCSRRWMRARWPASAAWSGTLWSNPRSSWSIGCSRRRPSAAWRVTGRPASPYPRRCSRRCARPRPTAPPQPWCASWSSRAPTSPSTPRHSSPRPAPPRARTARSRCAPRPHRRCRRTASSTASRTSSRAATRRATSLTSGPRCSRPMALPPSRRRVSPTSIASRSSVASTPTPSWAWGAPGPPRKSSSSSAGAGPRRPRCSATTACSSPALAHALALL